MDYSKTTFEDNQFDAIYTMEAFVHSPNVNKTLREFYRILKPDGKLVMFEYTMADDKKFTNYEKKMMDMMIEGGAVDSLRFIRHDLFPDTLKRNRFVSVKEQDISEHIEPSFRRLYKLSIIPYFFVKFFGLQRRFINVTTGYEMHNIEKKGLLRYCIFTAIKPRFNGGTGI